MAKTIKFKDPNGTFNLGGQIIGEHQLDDSLYNHIIGLNPKHADMFIVTEDEVIEDVKVKPEAKATKAKAE